MQSLRTTIQRLPRQLNRITKPTTRTFTHTPTTMSLFPRFTQEFAPIFRLFDEYDRQAFRDVDRDFTNSIRSFTPKFDVKETKEAYELHGELPGVDQKNVSIEWTDNNTLTISGKHEHVREEGQRPTAIEDDSEQKRIETSTSNNDTARQPRVEDESAEPAKSTQVATQSQQQDVARNSTPKHKYWVSERSVGSFHRSFAFPARVDQDAVKASLKNGILSIVVPKATAPQSRKVNIE